MAEYSDKGETMELRAHQKRTLLRQWMKICLASFLWKSGLFFSHESDCGNPSEDSSTFFVDESSDTEAVHAHFCSNIHPIYQKVMREKTVIQRHLQETNAKHNMEKLCEKKKQHRSSTMPPGKLADHGRSAQTSRTCYKDHGNLLLVCYIRHNIQRHSNG